MNIPRLLLRLARLTIPDNRLEWLHAMEAELDHVPIFQHRAFAWGCLLTSAQERIKTMTRIPPLRIIPGLFAAAVMVILCLANGIRMFADAPVVGGILIAAGALWIAVWAAVHAQSSERLAKFAIAGLAF